MHDKTNKENTGHASIDFRSETLSIQITLFDKIKRNFSKIAIRRGVVNF